ncbi:MAG: arylsulfotransferase family protein, partial [Candidatus Dormiibacterota bacterium]
SRLKICDANASPPSFEVAETAPPLPGAAASASPSPASPPLTQMFLSDPALQPPELLVSKAAPEPAEGDIFLSPDPAAGHLGQAGPMIVNGQGQLIWFDPVPQGELATDLRPQIYRGKRVLTFFEGDLIDGHGVGHFVIMNNHYRVIRTLAAAEGYSTDLHELLLGAGGSAWLAAYQPEGWNLSSVGGPADGAVYDCVVQELDLKTGNVLFEWHSLDHVKLSDSYIPYASSSTTPWDYFHLNSIDPLSDGTILISARNTEGVYLIDQASGRVIWTLGGKSSSFAMGPGAAFALQHDAELHGQSTLTLFDDEDDTADGPPARALELHLNLRRHTASLVWARQIPGFLLVLNQGNVQLLADGDVVAGWGAGTYTTEYSKGGKLLFKAHFAGLTNSYRAYRDPWSAQPAAPPTLAVGSSSGGTLRVYASWNGSTDVSRWRVVGGASRTHFTTVGSESQAGFQTTIPVTGNPALVKVEALSKAGRVLASSKVVATG